MSISKEQILEALRNSGYLLEDRVNKTLSSLGWSTIPNTRFKDLNSQVEREIDVMALNLISDHNENLDLIQSTLLIECMNNKEPIAFFENLSKSPNRIAALNFNVLNDYFWNILSWSQNEIDSKSELIWSSQYCGFQQVQKLKKEFNEGWIAAHPNEKHDSLNSFFQYIQYHRSEFKNTKNRADFVSGFYYRPLIVLQGDLISVTQEHELEIRDRNHIKYQIPKTDNNGRYFTIDIIKESYLTEYLSEIKKEDVVIASMVNKHREKLIDEHIA